MSRIGLILITVFGLTTAHFHVYAEDFDGSKTLLGKVIKIIEIHSRENIHDVDPETVGLPHTFIIDFKQKIIRPSPDSRIRKTSKIKRIEHIENKLILQGTEEGVEGVNDGLGWSMAISKETGSIVLAASGDKKAYVVFGTCTPDSSK
ncbi:MAG: hypothetical protein PVI06_05225 [Desulfobacterales bacterium]